MHKHRWAVFAAAFLVAGAVVAASFAGSSRSTAGKTFYFIPKDTLNPYEVIADGGGKLALDEIGNKQGVSSGTQDTAAAQIPSTPAAIQPGATPIQVAGHDPARPAPCPPFRAGEGPRPLAPRASDPRLVARRPTDSHRRDGVPP